MSIKIQDVQESFPVYADGVIAYPQAACWYPQRIGWASCNYCMKHTTQHPRYDFENWWGVIVFSSFLAKETSFELILFKNQ